MSTAIFLVVIFAVVIIWVVIKTKKENEEKWKKEGYKSTHPYAKFYRLCVREGIINIDEPASQNNVYIIAKREKYGVASVQDAVRLYRKGQKIDSKDQMKELYYKKYEEYRTQKEEADLVGVDKYLRRARLDIAAYQFYHPSALRTTASEKSVKGAALKGSLIGGHAYGVASAMETQRRNEAIREAKEKDRERIAKYDASEDTVLRRFLKYDMSKSELESKIAAVERRLIDDSQPREWSSSIHCFDMSCRVTEENTIRVTGCLTLKKNFKILKKRAILDGSLKFNIYDDKESFVGSAYYSAPGKDDLSMNQIGFAAGHEINAVFVPEIGVVLDSSKKYHCKITPYHLWLIEAGNNGYCPEKLW